jgi:1-deoxy-D-xylulose-5-phosphate synthase
LIGYGTGVALALDASRLLGEQGLEATVCDARFSKPLDLEMIDSLAAEHELLVTVEENVLAGGFGSAVLEHLSDSGALRKGAPRLMRFGIPDRYVTHGKPELLRAELGLTADRIAGEAAAALDRRPVLRSA